MKILFVGNTAWSMWNFRREVMLDFKSKGHEVVVVAPNDEGSDLLREHFKFEPIYSLSRKGKNPFRDLSLMFELFKIYKRHDPDHIFQYTIKPNLYGSVAASLCRKKPYSMVAGMGYVFTNVSILTVVVSIMYRIATTLSQKVLFLNQDDIRDFRRLHMLPKNSTKALLLPGEGVDTEHFSPRAESGERRAESGERRAESGERRAESGERRAESGERRAESGERRAESGERRAESGERRAESITNKTEYTFVFVGRLLIDKGIREFLKTARIIRKKFPEIQFNVIGPIDSGNPMAISEDELQSYISDRSINYFGSVTDVRPFIKEADALILPTYYGEGLSRVCLESLSMGVPVIATDNRGCTQIVINKVTGLIVPQSDLAALPVAVEEFIHLTEEQRIQMGKNGHELVKNDFSMGKVIEFYNKLASDNANQHDAPNLIQVTQLQSSKT